MESKQLKLGLFIMCILALCVGLRLCTQIEKTNVNEDKLQEVDVTRQEVTPDEAPKSIKKKSKKKVTKKKATKINGTVFEDIGPDESRDYNAVVEIHNSEPEKVEPINHPDQDYSTPKVVSDDIRLPDSFKSEADILG